MTSEPLSLSRSEDASKEKPPQQEGTLRKHLTGIGAGLVCAYYFGTWTANGGEGFWLGGLAGFVGGYGLAPALLFWGEAKKEAKNTVADTIDLPELWSRHHEPWP